MRGDTVLIHASDSDAVARYLLTSTPARDLEITARGIEDAFLALTGDDDGSDQSAKRRLTMSATLRRQPPDPTPGGPRAWAAST